MFIFSLFSFVYFLLFLFFLFVSSDNLQYMSLLLVFIYLSLSLTSFLCRSGRLNMSAQMASYIFVSDPKSRWHI